MRNKDTGEFELIVGNGQLVSGFFIVVLLFAVGVAMGYILGQNSEKSAKTQTGETAPCVATDGRPQPSQPSQPAQPPVQQAAASEPAPPAEAQPESGQEAPPQPTTQPAKQPEPAPAAPATKPAETDTAKSAPAPKTAAPSASDAPSGFFWQVTAKANHESARATLKILKERGFPAYLAPGPNNLTRVLVGPYQDTSTKAKAKTDLEAMGFKPIRLDRD
jgi:cell division septation protein DedD